MTVTEDGHRRSVVQATPDGLILEQIQPLTLTYQLVLPTGAGTVSGGCAAAGRESDLCEFCWRPMPLSYSAEERRRLGVPIGQGGPMKRLLVGAACVVAALVGVQGIGWAAPTNGHNTETLVVQCADDTVRVIIKPDGGASGWDVNAQRELTGIRYFSTALAGRFYPGELTTEPTDVDPIFTIATDWGNRTGHGASLSCSGTETFTAGGQVFTGFFDLTVTQQDKGN